MKITVLSDNIGCGELKGEWGLNEKEVRSIAHKIKDAGINRVITVHCTGKKAYAILKTCLGEAIEQFHCGMVVEL